MRIELRNDSVLLDGYVNAVARDSRVMIDDSGGRYVEQIMPKTFQRALEANDDIYCLLDHLDWRKLGCNRQVKIL